MRRSPNVTVLLAGIAMLALGVLLVLDAGGAIELRFAYTAPVLVGALGAILLAGGLASRGRARGRGHDHGATVAEIISGDVRSPGEPPARRPGIALGAGLLVCSGLLFVRAAGPGRGTRSSGRRWSSRWARC